MSETCKRYIVKYALSVGIYQEVGELILDYDKPMFVVTDGTSREYFHGNEFCETLEQARKLAKELQAKKIVNLEKTLERVKALDFSNSPITGKEATLAERKKASLAERKKAKSSKSKKTKSDTQSI